MPAPLRLCFVSSEFAPLAKTGGLADVLGALSRYLHSQGHDIRPFLPLHSRIDTTGLKLTPVSALQDLPLTLGTHKYRFSVLTTVAPGSSLPVYLIQCPTLFDRPSLYTHDSDEHLRYLLLTRAAIESCQHLQFSPQIFHCHDWHTAFAPLFLKSIYAWDRLFAGTKTVFTIHNLGYQGAMPATARADLGLDPLSARMLAQEDLQQGQINAMRHGIIYADCVTTVSPTYAREILTHQYGAGLQTTLRGRTQPPVGILNGVDYAEWNPATDPYIQHHYDVRRLAGKKKNKQALLKQLSLKLTPQAPLIGIVSRMARQKGFELLFEALPRFLSKTNAGFAILGNGEARYEDFFAALQHHFPERVAFHRGYNEALAHVIEAGSDIFLMPSLYEPCGLNQMYSLRYGTVPIVRRTGGLADSVQHFDPATSKGNGIVFNDYDSAAVTWALNTALEWFGDQVMWKRIVRNGMKQDYSWEHQGAEYVQLYRRLLGITE